MNLSRYISKNFILKLAFFAALIVFAALFDTYHHSNQTNSRTTSKSPVQSESEKLFFCSQVTNFNVKTLGTENPVRLRFTFNQDKLLIKYYNQRTFQLMKAETTHATLSAVRYFHSVPYRRFFYSSPDDIPPLV